MLQNSLQNLGSTFQRQREQDAMNAYRQQQLDEEKRRTAVDQAFRDAQMQRLDKQEQRQNDNYNIMESIAKLKEAREAAAEKQKGPLIKRADVLKRYK